MSFDPHRLAMQLRVMRHRAGLTQKELSARSEVGEKNISALESRATRTARIHFCYLVAITEACGFSISDFLQIVPTEEEALFLNFPVPRHKPEVVRRDTATSPYPSATCALGWQQ